MSELVSFEDTAEELRTSSEDVTKLVSSGKLRTAEEGGLLMVTRESLDVYKGEGGDEPLKLAEPEPEAEGVPTIALGGAEAAETEVEEAPAEAPAAEAAGEKTESIFGDEGFELETFEDVGVAGAPGEELAELEEAGEQLGAEEAAELTLREEAPARLRAMAARPRTSTGVSVMVILTFILLLFAGLMIFNFARATPQSIVEPINNWLLGLVK